MDTLNNSMNSADGVSQPNDRVNVLGVGISPVNLDTAEDLIFNAIDSGQQGYVGVTGVHGVSCLLYTSPSPRDGLLSRMPSSA